ncbi:hypothetical protein BKK81_12130 [Cupriavidus sp. USMAHM13]|uniref:hypothetical protein n=1 Tax=Cupriavidus sp. USMAHM13 TaxID=1389192 RepID=UPI0008A6C178|nr:hypothetical protein [Cupriavidus sp. USMAHM13]AOY99908.1 hypothetical protein BKK81_12130 [Cupriavidus sp. USMAHM13]
MAVTDTHEEKETLAVDVLLPGHEPRATTALFERTKKLLIAREGGRCYVCGATAQESGQPLEAHHHPIERSLANMIDWAAVQAAARAGALGTHAAAFDWAAFDPADPHTFVDDMTVNGLLLCRQHHTGKDAGIHALPFPLWLAQKFGREGYQFTPGEVIHHAT